MVAREDGTVFPLILPRWGGQRLDTYGTGIFVPRTSISEFDGRGSLRRTHPYPFELLHGLGFEAIGEDLFVFMDGPIDSIFLARGDGSISGRYGMWGTERDSLSHGVDVARYGDTLLVARNDRGFVTTLDLSSHEVGGLGWATIPTVALGFIEAFSDRVFVQRLSGGIFEHTPTNYPGRRVFSPPGVVRGMVAAEPYLYVLVRYGGNFFAPGSIFRVDVDTGDAVEITNQLRGPLDLAPYPVTLSPPDSFYSGG